MNCSDCVVCGKSAQINRTIGSAISDRVTPEIQIIMGSLSSGRRDTESGRSVNNQDSCEKTNGLKTKLTKNDSRSAFDLRDTGDTNPYSSLNKKTRELH